MIIILFLQVILLGYTFKIIAYLLFTYKQIVPIRTIPASQAALNRNCDIKLEPGLTHIVKALLCDL